MDKFKVAAAQIAVDYRDIERNVATHYRIAPMNVNTPAPMRGPGEATGLFVEHDRLLFTR